MATAELPKNADELRREMRQIRRELGQDVEGIVENAGRLVDWRYYMRTYPWAAVGLAAVAGYALVPQRAAVVTADAKSLSKLAKNNQVMIHSQPQATTRPSLADTAMSLAGNMLLRATLAYAGQQIGKLMGESAAEATEENAHA